MPANEQTWRDQKLLHIVFGVSSVLMLLATLWMLAADHNREWKQYQRKFRDVETWTAESRISQTSTDEYNQVLAERQAALDQARKEVPPQKLVDDFKRELRDDADSRDVPEPKLDRIDTDYKAVQDASDEERGDERDELIETLNEYVNGAKFLENNMLTAKKFKAADFDVARSNYELAVGNSAPQEEQDRLQSEVDRVKEQVDTLVRQVEQARTHRKELEKTLAQITARETEARKELEAHQQTLVQLEKALADREDNFGKELLAMPIIDAFGRPLKVDQIWLPKLTINNNFRDVARFDRCTTCHQAIEKSAPGSAIEPGYREQQGVALSLPTPAEPPAGPEGKPLSPDEIIQTAYGMQLYDRGLLNENDVTVSVVRPESPAAKARLMVGDVIEQIGDVKIRDRALANTYLTGSVTWGQPLKLQVRRGLPNPYTTHPRLDLFVGSLSPHKLQDVGCTICHEGQGSGTAFKWASHSPNTPAQASAWKQDHGWFNNHHWIFPMHPERFAESSCLKCHHEVTELEVSEKFAEPPAPKLMAGYDLIRQYGCFGCHEINGHDGPTRRIGPDLRSEPNYAAAAQALLAVSDLSEQQQDWATRLVSRPGSEDARHSLLQSIKYPVNKGESENEAKVAPATLKLANLLDDVESPGKFRKVGPSLRSIKHKADFAFLYSWIRNPADFRPTTRMPRFFGLTDHLEGKGLQDSKRFEPAEIRGITEYLLDKSQKFAFLDRPEGVTEEPSAERGKRLFETRGCLACHQHADFPKAQMTQGPDLSRIGAKLDRQDNPDGPGWLYTWLRDPSAYHPRTVMPNLILEPLAVKDEKGKETGKVTDPAGDIAVYLLGGKDWQPKDVPGRKLTEEERTALNDLAFDHLKNVFTQSETKKFLETGIPESRAGELKGDEVELLGGMSEQKLLNYVGRRSISKYGCSGCHDIPGFEDAKPIGTGLADWGRKGADKLAFEQIAQYIHSAHGEHSEGHGEHGHGEHGNGDAAASHEMNYEDMDPTEGFFMEKLMGHERTGFIWQKLRAPRSYDYKKTENKGYNERLRMPKFTFDHDPKKHAEKIEQIITFVLGLVAEPPAQQYVYSPSPRRAAIVEGLKVIDKFNCTGCHAFELEKWKLAYSPDEIRPPAPINDFNFLKPHFTAAEINESLKSDNRGLRSATIAGMPSVDEQGKIVRRDEDGAPIDDDDTESEPFYSFQPWKNVLLNGEARLAGVQNIAVPAKAIDKKYPAFGGYLAQLIFPAVVAYEKQINPQAKPDEAWAWLPPPLVNEGRKVQANWLHDFLLDPYPIRPAVLLRMPKFNMSSADASKLVNYFAAIDNAEYPYEQNSRRKNQELASSEVEGLSDALKIIVDNNYCVKCHLIGDFAPGGSDRAKGPRLDQVYKRFRPDYLQAWVANPKRLLPYTAMPVNIPPDKPVAQTIYKGDSLQQVHGLVDLLMNYDRYTESKTPIAPMVKPAPAAPAEPPATQ